MKIKFNGIEPNARYFRFGVQQNNLVDDLELEINARFGDTVLTEFKPFIKISTSDLKFADKDGNIEITPDGDKLLLRYKLNRTILQFKSVDMQIQFERYDDADVIVWQSVLFNIAFFQSIPADKIIENKQPTVIQDHERRIKKIEETASGGVIEFQSKYNFPPIGLSGVIYIDKSANMCYRFDEDKQVYLVVGSDYNDINIINGNGGY